MSSPKTRNAYNDCYDLYDKALSAPHGIRFRVPTEASALNLRMRLHSARAIDRDDNARIYDRGTPMHGSSIHDPLQVLIRDDPDGQWWVYIEPRSIPIIGEIEELQPYTEDDPKWLAQSSPPQPISTSGMMLLEKRSDLESNAPIESSSSTPSMQPEREPTTPGLRRL